MSTYKVAALRLPLVFDPGDKWEYGINIEWVGNLPRRGDQRADARHPFPRQLLRHSACRIAATSPRTSSARARPECISARLTVPWRHSRWRHCPRRNSGRVADRSYRIGWDYLAFSEMPLHGGSFNGVRLLRLRDGGHRWVRTISATSRPVS